MSNDIIDTIVRGNGPGRGGIGFVGADVPVDLLIASGRPFGHLPWHAGPTPWADRWLEGGFPFWARSILESWHEGRFDELSAVVFSRSDDASQRLYYYVRELQGRGQLRGPAPRVFDCALIPRESSCAHTVAAIRELATGLDVADLEAAVVRGNLLRAALLRVQQGRRGDGAHHERLGRAALFSDASAWIESIPEPAGAAGLPALVLAGSVPPDDRLHRAVEGSGACVTLELHVHALARLGPPVDIDGADPAVAIARHLIANAISPRSFIDRAAALVTAVRRANARGVVLWLTREEEALAWHVPAQRRALEAAGIAALIMTARDWRAEDGAVEEINAFCRSIAA